jgi:hypothetical protein
VALRHSFIHADIKNSNFIICTDPIGESLLVSERAREEDDWHTFSGEELAMLIIVHLKAFIETKDKDRAYYVSIEGPNKSLESLCR